MPGDSTKRRLAKTRTASGITAETTSPTDSSSSTDANNMASMAAVLAELKLLRADFGSKLDNINDRLTDVANSITSLEGKMTNVEKDVSSNTQRIDEAEARISTVEDQLHRAQTDLTSAAKRIAYLESKTDDLENRGRRKNLRLLGLREGAEGTQTLFDFVNNMLPRWLGLAPDKTFTLERVHRTLGPAKPNQSRAVLIRFLKFQEKESVYQATRRRDITHDGAKISFSQDLSAETVRVRRGFNAVTKLFVDMGAFRGFQHNPCKLRVLHDGKIHLFSTPQDAEKFHHDIK